MNRRPPRTSAEDQATLTYLLIGLLIGAVLGGAVGYSAASSRSAQPDSEVITSAGGGAIRATGAFIQSNPADRVHYGSGTLSVYDDRVELSEDFAVGPGPKYHLYLVPQRGIDPDTRVEETMFVDLGPLKAFSGAQSYPIPVGLDLADFGSAVVWCEQFNTLISPAEFSPVQ